MKNMLPISTSCLSRGKYLLQISSFLECTKFDRVIAFSFVHTFDSCAGIYLPLKRPIKHIMHTARCAYHHSFSHVTSKHSLRGCSIFLCLWQSNKGHPLAQYLPTIIFEISLNLKQAKITLHKTKHFPQYPNSAPLAQRK